MVLLILYSFCVWLWSGLRSHWGHWDPLHATTHPPGSIWQGSHKGSFGEWEATLWTGAGSLLPFSFGQSELYKSFTMYCRSGQEGLQSPLTRMGAVQAVEWMGLMCKVSVLWFLPTTGESLQGFSSYRFFLMPLLSFLCWDQGPGLRCSLNWVSGTHKCTFCVGLFQDIMNKDEILNQYPPSLSLVSSL